MSNFYSFFREYSAELSKSLFNLEENELDNITKIIEKTIKNKKNIFTCGNGGSASVSNHFLCDFNKGVNQSSKGKIKPKVISLNTNIEMITAISNDIDYKKIFSYQLESFASKGDLFIAFSCSGSSKNIIDALLFAKKKKLITIGFLGFANKKNQNLFDYSVNVGFKNYGITEDIFQILMHAISQFIRMKSIKNFNKKKNIL